MMNGRRKPANGECHRWVRDVAMNWESDDCIFYPFSAGSHGYGPITIDGKADLVHRYVCTITHGSPPTPRHQAAHSCGKKLCVNRRHLRWATRAENEADKLIHGTQTRGARHGHSRLSEAHVLAIRVAQGSQRKIAAEFGITQQTVSDIKCRRRWAWL